MMRFVAQYPDHPWWNVCETIVQEIAGDNQGAGPLGDEAYRELAGQRFGISTPRHMLGARYNPIHVGDGSADVGIATPTATAVMARDGRGPFDRPLPDLRAIAAYPHDDFLLFLVDSRLAAGTLADVLQSGESLRIVTGRVAPDGTEDVLTHCVREVMRLHGATFEVITSGGGEVVFGGPTRVAGRLLLGNGADALFHEAQGHPVWAEIVSHRNMTAVPLDESLAREASELLSLPLREVPPGHAVGNISPLLTLDFSGWLLFATATLSDAEAYALAVACDRSRSRIEERIPDRSLRKPLDPVSMFNDTGIPLHSGAARYAEEKGYLR